MGSAILVTVVLGRLTKPWPGKAVCVVNSESLVYECRLMNGASELCEVHSETCPRQRLSQSSSQLQKGRKSNDSLNICALNTPCVDLHVGFRHTHICTSCPVRVHAGHPVLRTALAALRLGVRGGSQLVPQGDQASVTMKFTVKFLRGGLAFVTCYGVWYVVLTGINSATKVVDSATSKDNLMEGSSLVAESIASLDYHDETLNKIKDTAAAMKELPKDSYLGPLLESPYMYAGNHTFPPEVDEVWQTRSNYSIDHFEPCKDCFFSRDCFSDNLWHPQTCGAVRLFGPQHPIPVECLERESILLIGDSRARLLYFDIFAAMGGDERLVDYMYGDHCST